MKITDEIIDFYFICKLKAQYKYESIEFSDPSFYYYKKSLKKTALKKFSANYRDIKFVSTNNYEIYYPYICIDKNSKTPIFFKFKQNKPRI